MVKKDVRCTECKKRVKGEPFKGQLIGQVRWKSFCCTDCIVEYYAGEGK